MKTVLHFRSNFLPLSETFIYSQIVNSKKWKAKIFCFRKSNSEYFPYNDIYCVQKLSNWDKLRMGSIKFLPISSYLWKNIPSNFEYEVLKTTPIDILHAHFGTDGNYATRLKKITKKPLVLSVYGFDATKLLRRHPKYYTYIKNDLDAIIALSDYLKNKLIDHGVDIPIYVNRLGVDVDAINFRLPNTPFEREIRLLNIGRLVEKKGHKYLIEAINILVNKKYDVTLDIIGSGPLYVSIKFLIKKYGLSDNIKLLGAIPNHKVIRILNDYDLFIFPSIIAGDGDAEGLGIAPIEAMASGLPVIATKHNGIPEYIINNITGILVSEKDPNSIAEAVIELISNYRKVKN